MTDRIDIDELDVDTDGETDEGETDWLDGDAGGWGTTGERAGDASADATEAGGDESAGASGEADDAPDGASEARDARAVPHVPRRNDDRPAGIPVESGGAGAGAAPEDGAAGGAAGAERSGSADAPDAAGSGPHGGGADDLTLAISYGAMKRLENPRLACADANQWADWVGVVGDVPAHVLTNFQREHGLDLDFFNGGGKGPAERLAAIDEHSMFYADRMLLVGVDDGDEAVAEQAGWEHIDLGEAAEKADWTLAE